jgi:hypothetical protein
MTALEKTIQDISIKLDKIAEVILGDPTDKDKPGVMIRLDRLERSKQNTTKLMWALATGIMFTAGQVLFSMLQ